MSEREPPTLNLPGLISLITGTLALLGQGCCCLPVLNYVAMVIVPLFTLTALITGFIGLQKSRMTDDSTIMPVAGLMLGAINLLIGLAWGALVFSLVGLMGIAAATGG